MMDAVWSSVVVVLAFMATFMALENGTKTANRDLARTAAYDVAQDELSNMRDLGKKDLNALLALNNTNTPPSSPNKTVTLNGTDYDVWYSAYYVTGLGNNSTDACGGSYSGNGTGTAKFIYMKVTVTYDGISATAAYPSLDEYFAPEGGDTNAATGTLRLYLLKPPSDTPWSGVSVSLSATDPGMNYSTTTKTTNSAGCVLFTGLPRGSYNAAVTTSKYDIYLANISGATLNVPLTLPDRAAISKDIRMDSPVKVTPEFWTNNGTTDIQAVPTTSTTTGPSTLIGPWIGRSSNILMVSGTDFTTLPGTTYLPHGSPLPSYAANYMYPDPNGYDIFAGPCDDNAPDTLKHIPSTGNTTWSPGATYLESSANPKIFVPQLRVTLAPVPADDSAIKNRAIKNATPGGMRVLVKLKNGASESDTATSSAICGPRASLFNSWVRLKGTMWNQLGATGPSPGTPAPNWNRSLADDAEALPEGKYDVCIQAHVSYYKISGGVSVSDEIRYISVPNVNLDTSQTITAKPFGTQNVDWQTTDCSGGASWSP